MKKILSMMLVLAAMLAIFAVPAHAAEIALVTDVGTIDDERGGVRHREQHQLPVLSAGG